MIDACSPEPCIIVNIAVHPDVLQIISRAQLIRSTFDLVASQHQVLVDYDHYAVLQETCIGNLAEIQQNFVKPLSKTDKDETNAIEEEFIENGLSPSLLKQLSSMTMAGPSNSAQKQTKKPVKPPVLIEELWSTPSFTEEIITSNNTSLVIRIALPECESVADCDVTVLPREDLVQLECTKLHIRLKLDMKKHKKPTVPDNCQSTFDIQRLTAKFVRKTQQLILSIPIVIEPKTNEQNKELKAGHVSHWARYASIREYICPIVLSICLRINICDELFKLSECEDYLRLCTSWRITRWAEREISITL